jgi:hypothetical protein
MSNQNTAIQVDPFDPSRFAANSTVVGDIGVTKEFVTCPVRKPDKKEFIRIHPELKLAAHILELKVERETYLVEPSVAVVLAGDVRSVVLTLAVSRQGAWFLWPVPQAPLDGRDNSWNQSARIAARLAESKWVRVVSRMDQQAYEVLSAPGTLGSPIWPDVGMREILMVAFGESFVVRDAGHPVVKRLLGQA